MKLVGNLIVVLWTPCVS